MNRRKFIQTSSAFALFLPLHVYAAREQDRFSALVDSIDDRLKRVRDVVGYGNFNIISFDRALSVAKAYPAVGAFSREETDFIEQIFYKDAREFGFYGLRTCNELTQPVFENDVAKIPATGHYLYKDFVTTYKQIKNDIGDTITLTSGVRSVTKQLSLFVNSVRRSGYDLQRASYSLAPPGYSYHSCGDFDVGKVGYGWANFTERFAKTDEFKRLVKLNYIDIRYRRGNSDGVRYEPWHVQVV
ncbi:MAG: D-alanyl-D-alanine carboxypeptidase family protein [Campylobacterota bacterium]